MAYAVVGGARWHLCPHAEAVTMSDGRQAKPSDANATPPDWNTVTVEVTCSRCAYNLRSLVRPVCPECGLEFWWSDVLEAAVRSNKFLFEHNWRTRPVRSLVWTVWHSFRPSTFWSKVSIHEQPNVRALWLMLLMTSICFFVVLYSVAWGLSLVISLTEPLWLPQGWQLISQFPFFPQPAPVPVSPQRETMIRLLLAYRDDLGGMWRSPSIEDHLLRLFGPLIEVLTAACVVKMLWQTLGRYRIPDAQILRVMTYAAIPASVVTTFSILLTNAWMLYIDIASFVWPGNRMPYGMARFTPVLLIMCAIALPLSFYLSAGLRHYLRLPHVSASSVL